MFVCLGSYGHLFNEVEAWFGNFLAVTCNEGIQVDPYNFRDSGVAEEARWEGTSQQTKELQRQLLPCMGEKN